MMKLVRALLQSLGSPESEPGDPPILDANAALEAIMGRETVARVEGELDYQRRVEQAERLIELRERELAAKRKLEALR